MRGVWNKLAVYFGAADDDVASATPSDSVLGTVLGAIVGGLVFGAVFSLVRGQPLASWQFTFAAGLFAVGLLAIAAIGQGRRRNRDR
jgi:tetrahydromethanopterin S-methyltransferase subunit D